eukprot:jgi/Bigna1/147545/aug1.194_g22253
MSKGSGMKRKATEVQQETLPLTKRQKKFAKWSKSDMNEWLERVDLGNLRTVFEEEDVKPQLLPKLTSADLVKIGIRDSGLRKRFLNAVEVEVSEPAISSVICSPSTRIADSERRHSDTNRKSGSVKQQPSDVMKLDDNTRIADSERRHSDANLKSGSVKQQPSDVMKLDDNVKYDELHHLHALFQGMRKLMKHRLAYGMIAIIAIWFLFFLIETSANSELQNLKARYSEIRSSRNDVTIEFAKKLSKDAAVEMGNYFGFKVTGDAVEDAWSYLGVKSEPKEDEKNKINLRELAQKMGSAKRRLEMYSTIKWSICILVAFISLIWELGGHVRNRLSLVRQLFITSSRSKMQ